MEQELGCKFVRIDSDKKDVDIPRKKALISLELSMKYIGTLNNQLKKHK